MAGRISHPFTTCTVCSNPASVFLPLLSLFLSLGGLASHIFSGRQWNPFMVHNSYRQHTLFMDFLNCWLCDLLEQSLLILTVWRENSLINILPLKTNTVSFNFGFLLDIFACLTEYIWGEISGYLIGRTIKKRKGKKLKQKQKNKTNKTASLLNKLWRSNSWHIYIQTRHATTLTLLSCNTDTG